MKKKLDNMGVDQKQTEILSLPLHSRQEICNLMRLSLLGALDYHFDLHPNQIKQLVAMSSDLKQRLGDRIARMWEMGNKVIFDKETTDQDDLPDKKLLEIIGIDDEPEDPEEDPPVVPLMIRIRYK